MCIIVAHVVSTIVFKYCNFVLRVNRDIMLDVFQEKTAGKFNICFYLSLSIKVVIKVWVPEYYMNMTPTTFIDINKEDRIKRTS